jgi:hypothetical protein
MGAFLAGRYAADPLQPTHVVLATVVGGDARAAGLWTADVVDSSAFAVSGTYIGGFAAVGNTAARATRRTADAVCTAAIAAFRAATAGLVGDVAADPFAAYPENSVLDAIQARPAALVPHRVARPPCLTIPHPECGQQQAGQAAGRALEHATTRRARPQRLGEVVEAAVIHERTPFLCDAVADEDDWTEQPVSDASGVKITGLTSSSEYVCGHCFGLPRY